MKYTYYPFERDGVHDEKAWHNKQYEAKLMEIKRALRITKSKLESHVQLRLASAVTSDSVTLWDTGQVLSFPRLPQVPILSANPIREHKQQGELSSYYPGLEPRFAVSQISVLTTTPQRRGVQKIIIRWKERSTKKLILRMMDNLSNLMKKQRTHDQSK